MQKAQISVEEIRVYGRISKITKMLFFAFAYLSLQSL